MPYMEGPFSNDEAADNDKSFDPVGQYSAVIAMASIFQGLNIDEDALRLKIENEEPMVFNMMQIGLFATVVRS